MTVAGCADDSVFGDDCYDVIARYTGGIPRLVNTLCDTSLLIAFADDKKTLTADDIMDAATELSWKEYESDTGRFNTLDQVIARHGPSAQSTQIEILADGVVVSVQTFGPGRIIIGRSPDNEICIQSKFVSRHHAQLIIDEKGCIVEDLNSTNGVFFGERQIKKQLLASGDSVAIGAHDLVYTDLRDADENQDEELDEKGPSATFG
jgi:general secretion pathway protein A